SKQELKLWEPGGAFMADVWVLAGARGPLGSFGGSCVDVSAEELGVAAAGGAVVRAGVDPKQVDNVVMGNVIQTHNGAPYLARHVALRAGIPIETPALTVNRLCGSGLQAVVSGAQSILLGESEIGLVGGAENMSQAPYALRGVRWGMRMGDGVLADTLTETLTDRYCGLG